MEVRVQGIIIELSHETGQQISGSLDRALVLSQKRCLFISVTGGHGPFKLNSTAP